jgi:hypothetical protein
VTPEQIIDLIPEADAQVLKALLASRGGRVDPVLNEIVLMAVTLAIAAGVEPETFAEGVQYAWKEVADQVNAATLHDARPAGHA